MADLTSRALAVASLADALRALPAGGALTYAEANSLVSDDGAALRFLLADARKRVEQEGPARFATVRGRGVRRLETAEIVGIGAQARASIGRRARRAGKRLADIRVNDLSPAERAAIDAERSVLGAIAVLSRDSAAIKAREVAQTGPILPKDVLQLVAG